MLSLIFLGLLVVTIGYRVYNNQVKLSGPPTGLRVSVEQSRGDYIDVRLSIRNNMDTETVYNWSITFFYGNKERVHPFSYKIKGGSGVGQIISFLPPLDLPLQEKENIKVGIKVYEEGELMEDRVLYLNSTRPQIVR